MSALGIAIVGLLVGALGPAIVLACRGDALERLVGLQFAVAGCALVLLAYATWREVSSYLVVPLALVVIAPAGTLVFTRLLGPREEQSG